MVGAGLAPFAGMPAARLRGSRPWVGGTRHTVRMGRKRARKSSEPRGRSARPLPDFTHLPERVPPERLTTTQDVEPAPDPRGGRDTETEFMLRNAGF